MNRWKNLGIIATGLGALAVPIGVSVAGAGSATADPGLCVNGPFGYAQACVDGPGWNNGWYDGPRWRGGWDGDHWGEDD